MEHLTRHDFALALNLLRKLEDEARDPHAFPLACLHALADYVPCESALFECGDTPLDAHALSIPVARDTALCITLRRRANPFCARERERLALVAPHIAFLWSLVHGEVMRPIATQPHADVVVAEPIDCKTRLTRRESEVMRWLACGKTDADIAAFLAISPRTVHKHLEHIYVKLGVETRTAAVMRMERVTGGGTGGMTAARAVVRGLERGAAR